MRSFFLLIIAISAVPSLRAQLPNTDLQMISPAFAKAGSTIEVTVSGEHLEELKNLRFSDTRIQAEPVMEPADEFFPEPRPVANRFKVSIPAEVEPGICEVRSLGFFGLSTARPFMVLPADAVEIKEEGDHSSREAALPLEIETGVTGYVDSRKIDWFKFVGKKGERLLIQIHAERLDSRLDGLLVVYDSEGRELERNRQYFDRDPLVDFSPAGDGEYFIALSDILYRGGSQHFYRLQISRAPHIDFVFPPAGRPGEKTRFTIYGRNLPGGSPGEDVSIHGKPLDALEVEIEVPGASKTIAAFSGDTPRRALLPGFEYRQGNSNAARIGFATAPVVLEETDADFQNVTIPCEIAGRFDEPGDDDAFRFPAKKGEMIWIEVISDRMAVSADTVVLVRKIGKDVKGEETVTAVSESDDPASFFSVTNWDATNADTTDSSVSFTSDADGEYEVKLINQLASGSPAHLYRLAIRTATPDFHLLSSTERTITATNGRAGYPAAPVLRRSGSLVYRIMAPRQDGFDGDIVVTASGLPKGVTAPPLVLSGKSTNGFLTLTASADAPAWTGPVGITGKSTIDGKEVVRESRNASLIWGVIFSDSFRVRSRLDLETVLSVTDQEITPAFVATAEEKTWEVELNQKLEIPVKVTDFGTRKGNFTVQAHGFPGMLRSPPNVGIPEGKTDGTLTIDFKPNGNFKAEPGRFQFVLQGIGIAKYQHNPGAAGKAEAESKRLEALAKQFEGEVVKAKGLVAEAQKELDAAKKNAASASAAAKADLEKKTGEAQTKLDAANKAAADAEARSKKAAQLKDTAAKTAKSLADKAKEKDTKFAAFSTPISVTVKPVPEEPEK